MDSQDNKSPFSHPSAADAHDPRSIEEMVREQEKRFRQLAENIQEIFWMIDATTLQALYVNRAFEEITGRTCESLYRAPLSYREIIHPDDRGRVLTPIREIRAAGKFDQEFRIVRPDGSIRWVWTRGFPICDQRGKTYRIGGVVQDITQRKEAECALQASEDRYRDLVEHSQDLLCTHDLKGRILSCNPAPARILGYKVHELLEISLRDLLAPEVRDLFHGYLQDIQAHGRSDGFMVLLTRTGERRIWEYHNTLRTDGVSAPIVRGMAHDVTERRRAEIALRKSEERFRVALKNSLTMVFSQDANLRYTWIHNAILSWAEEDPIGKTDQQLLDVEDATHLASIKCQVLESRVGTRAGATITYQGNRYFLDLTIEPQFDNKGNAVGITCACVDITEFLKRTERLQTLLDVSYQLVSKLKFEDLFASIAPCVRHLIEYDFISLSVRDREADVMTAYPLDLSSAQRLMKADVRVTMEESLAGLALGNRDIKLFRGNEIGAIGSGLVRRLLGADIQSLCCIPINTSGGTFCTLNVGIRARAAFDVADLYVMRQLGTQLAIALDNAQDFCSLEELNSRLGEAKLRLERQLESELHFGEVIGNSPAIRDAIGRAQAVAGSTTATLIFGEPGTGKELIARAIHRMGPRSTQALIKVDCCEVPLNLLEAEIFGYDKSAVAEGIGPKPAAVELADGGTLFFDEVAQLPLRLQLRLLRLLEEKEFERVGGARTVDVDVQVIAATRWDLRKKVQEQSFRQELYYRLSVWPIRTVPLRERSEDIPLLVNHFVKRHARRMGRDVPLIPPETMEKMTHWGWPGNVRELENFIERSVILTRGNVLEAPLSELNLRSQRRCRRRMSSDQP